MQRLNTSYSRHYAHAYHTSGAVFGNRYTVEEVTEPEYFQNVIKYIALNPVRAGLVSKISDYRWSAHLDLVQKREGLVDNRRLYEILGKTPDRGRDIYQDLIQNAQKQTEALPRQKLFRARRKQKTLQAQLDTFLINTGSGIGSEQIQSAKRTSDIVQLRRDFARQAYSQGYSTNDIAAVLKVSPRSVRNWCLENEENQSLDQRDALKDRVKKPSH